MTKATIDDVAELAGVSIKTVSRVVNQEPNVSESTREKVEKAIAELNYRPNKAAQTLASLHSRLIVLIYDDPSAYEIPSAGFIIRMQEGALRACRTANYELLIHPCRYRSKNVDKELRALIEQVRRVSEAALRRGDITLEESALLRKRFAQGLDDYTYLSRDD